MKFRPSSRQTIQGAAFPDFIKAQESLQKRSFHDHTHKTSMRSYLLPSFLFFLVGLLSVRLITLQVFQGSYYRKLSDSNRIRTTTIHAPRGIIFDRNATPLVFNTPGFRKPRGEQGKTELLTRDEAITRIAKGEKNLEVDTLRQYPYKEIFSHVLGYLGEISEEELKMPLFATYQLADLIGKAGIEKQYERLLRGTTGKQLVEVDADGKTVRALGQQDPVAGRDIYLTLDAKLQAAAFSAMQTVKKGATIVTSPKGEVLAMVSKPSFDPNLFTMGQMYKVATESAYRDIGQILFDNQNQPLLNRAIAGAYPPGSTFKLITASAGLENHAIDEDFEVVDTGVLTVGVFSFGNWYYLQYGKTEGAINVVKAIKRSNDIFFYKLAEMVGVSKLSEMANRFGLGQKLGIDLHGEETGLVPTRSWKEKIIGEPWYLGDTYHYGIGQGYLLTTPLQVNIWTQIIANGGLLYEPHLLKAKSETLRLRSGRERKAKNIIGEKTREIIREGMIESCSPGGVAWPLFKFKIKNEKLKIDGENFLEVPEATVSASFREYREVSIACKTGTAEHGGEKTVPHAWITLFAPAYDPQIIVTVLAESSGEGSNIAAPIAKKILEAWFSR